MSAATTSTTQSASKRPRSTLLMDEFTTFRSELDQSQSQRERIVKISRDITALSKQMIFSLHRVASGKPWKAVQEEVEGKLVELRKLFAKVSEEVKGQDFWRYERSISPGLQEYLEGYTFYYYLQHRSLPSLAEAQASLLPTPAESVPPSVESSDPTTETTPSTVESSDPTTETTPSTTTANTTSAEVPSERSTQEENQATVPYVRVSAEDYLGGVADLTGELMRLAIASVGKNLNLSLQNSTEAQGEGGFADIDKIGRLVREIKGEMDPLAPYARWLNKKLVVLDQSLGKIENASYNLRIRGAEYKDSPKMLQELARKMATSSSNESSRDGGGPEGVMV